MSDAPEDRSAFEPGTDPWPDGDHMRRWLRDEKIIIDARMFLPTIDSCEELAGIAGGIRLWINASRTSWRADRDRKQRISKAIASLLADLPDLNRDLKATIDNYSRRQNEASAILVRLTQKEQSAVQALTRGLDAVKACPGIFASLLNRYEDIDKWHDYVDDLAKAFRDAARSTNPDEPFPPSNSGPLTRFLSAAIPHISGETPNTVAIARYLQRHAG